MSGERIIDKARTRDSLQALSKLAERVDGTYRIVCQPPLVVPLRDLASSRGWGGPTRPLHCCPPGGVPLRRGVSPRLTEGRWPAVRSL